MIIIFMSIIIMSIIIMNIIIMSIIIMSNSRERDVKIVSRFTTWIGLVENCMRKIPTGMLLPS